MIAGKAILAAYTAHLDGNGGVQSCTAEYIDILRRTGLEVRVIPVDPDRRPSTRLGRRLIGSPYFRPLSRQSLARVRHETADAQFLFLNQVALAGALETLGLPDLPVIALSHGCEITDLLHLVRLHRRLPLSAGQLRPTPALALAKTLNDEIKARRRLDGVISISPFDNDTELWLGTKKVCWLPRTIVPAPVARRPVFGRFGYVGTLDHSPNLEGLVLVLDQMDRTGEPNFEVRVVGGPERIGRWLARRYPQIRYLGSLPDDALREEAASWNGFIHPIFCLARGCSTKLAGALAWGIPIVTTSLGRRGYEWSEGHLIETNSPAEFVEGMRGLIDPLNAAHAAREVARVTASSPSREKVAAQAASFLSGVSTTGWAKAAFGSTP